MSVFTSNKKDNSKNTKMIGAHIDTENAHRLAMISLQNGQPRTKILKGLIDDYLKEQPTLNDLIKQAVKRAHKAWNTISFPAVRQSSIMDEEKKYKKFVAEIQQDLISHRIDKTIIETILNDLNDIKGDLA